MGDKPQKVIIDVVGTAVNTGRQAIHGVFSIYLLIITVCVALLSVLLPAAIILATLALLGTLIVVWYRSHPKFTSLFISISTLFLSLLFFKFGPVWAGIAIIFISLYGILILPPPNVDSFNFKVKTEKLYSIAIVAFIQISLAGMLTAGGYAITQSEYIKNMNKSGDERALCVFLFAFAGFFLYKGCINAQRQKDYITDPENAIEKWKRDKYWETLKFNVKHDPTGLSKYLYNEEAAKRGAKLIPSKKKSEKKILSPNQVERRRKFTVAKNVLKHIQHFGPKGG